MVWFSSNLIIQEFRNRKELVFGSNPKIVANDLKKRKLQKENKELFPQQSVHNFQSISIYRKV